MFQMRSKKYLSRVISKIFRQSMETEQYNQQNYFIKICTTYYMIIYALRPVSRMTL